jgi:hypothetical protein
MSWRARPPRADLANPSMFGARQRSMPLPPRDFDRIGPSEGEPFPDIRLPDQHGTTIDLHAARAGGKALVVFYRSADW